MIRPPGGGIERQRERERESEREREREIERVLTKGANLSEDVSAFE
jgi:hypothetical protein